MSAGEILLFHRPITWANFRRDKFGTVMCALIHLTTRSRYNHAALSIGRDENGVELMVEATNRGVVVSPVESADEITVIPMRFQANAALCEGPHGLPVVARYWGPKTLEQVLAWATARVGWRYGYGNAFWCGLRNMFPGIAHVKHGKSLICSEAVAEALERAGHDFGKDSALVSPGDLAEHFGVARK